ncbi:hypothetical protein GYA19_05335 [Candidatus Beckwithbacteria bacterium]|nr:hypothetical protein [Candidatus Beckwithbacteria bacterium]
MKNLIQHITALFSLVILAFSLATQTYAQECHSVYGGGEVCDHGHIDVDKKVWNPAKNEWWDNIDSSSYTFKANEEFKYEIRVKNTGDVTLHEVKVTDLMPDVDYIIWTGNWDWDSDDHKATWMIYDLEPGETEVRDIHFKFADSDKIPSGTTWVRNEAVAKVKNGDSDSDTATIYVRKAVLGVTTKAPIMPETGAESSIILAGELLALGLVGFGFLRIAKNKVSK